jgi:hypothetical protein
VEGDATEVEQRSDHLQHTFRRSEHGPDALAGLRGKRRDCGAAPRR